MMGWVPICHTMTVHLKKFFLSNRMNELFGEKYLSAREAIGHNEHFITDGVR